MNSLCLVANFTGSLNGANANEKDKERYNIKLDEFKTVQVTDYTSIRRNSRQEGLACAYFFINEQ